MLEPKADGLVNSQVPGWQCPSCDEWLTVYLDRKAERFRCRSCDRSWESMAFVKAREKARQRRMDLRRDFGE